MNDDAELEHEADGMGAMASSFSNDGKSDGENQPALNFGFSKRPNVVQGVFQVNRENVGRVIEERVIGYLEKNAPLLVNEFSNMVIDKNSDYGELADWLNRKNLDSSIVGSQVAEDVEIKSIAEMFKEIADDLKVPNKKILDIVVDLDVYNDYQVAKANSTLRGYKKDISPLLKQGWVAWTSCFDTSERLYNLLKNVPTLEDV